MKEVNDYLNEAFFKKKKRPFALKPDLSVKVIVNREKNLIKTGRIQHQVEGDPDKYFVGFGSATGSFHKDDILPYEENMPT